MLCSFLNSSNFSYKMDTHFTVTNNQIEIPDHLNYATYQLKGSWTDNYGKLGTILCNGETKIPKSNLVEIFGICEITDEDKNKRWWTINRDKSEIQLGVGKAKQIEGQSHLDKLRLAKITRQEWKNMENFGQAMLDLKRYDDNNGTKLFEEMNKVDPYIGTEMEGKD